MTAQQIEVLRRQRWTGKQIAKASGVSPATVSRVLKRLGPNKELPFWLHRYNWHRPHGAIKSQTPISRLRLSEDNLLRLHS